MFSRLRTPAVADIAEFAFRCSLARAFFCYGYDKLTGHMFNNAPAGLGSRALQDIDMFHLTWYWFQTNQEISWSIGILQILAAVLLLFNTTKIIGSFIFLPILSVILLIDVYCAHSAALSSRVIFYIAVCIGLLYRQRHRLRYLLITPGAYPALSSGTPGGKTSKNFIQTCSYFVLFLIIAFGLELLLLMAANLIFKAPLNPTA